VLAYQLVYTYQLYVLTDHVGLPDARASVVLGTLTAVTLVAVLVGAAVTGLGSDRLGRRTPFLVGACALLAVAVAVPLVWPTVAGMTVFAVLKGLASGAHLAAATAFVTEVLPADGTSPATDLGVFNVATNVPQALAPALAGLLVTHAGGYPALFVAAGVVAVLALVASRRAGRVAGTPTPQRVAA
jgi:MFS family permease